MSYSRKIFYVNFYEGEEKKGSAGYIKVLGNGEKLEAEVRLSGLSPAFDGEQELIIYEGQTVICNQEIVLKSGHSMGRYGWDKNVELSQMSFTVQLATGCFLSTGERKLREEENNNAGNSYQEAQEIIVLPSEEITVEPIQERELPQLEIAEEKEEAVERESERERTAKDRVENRKWKQIYKTYPHIQPFKDFREYIKLELKDMVLVSEKKYSLVENSFLLHGYYNYDHIILWKKEKAPVKYYIGVPGNFYEKEKQVAVLYGFESFEGAVEPAKEGDFGYYMTEVSI